MRLLCIDSSNPQDPHKLLPQDMVEEGEIYTWTGSVQENTGLHYHLAEKRAEVRYLASRFVPLSDPEEEEAEEAEKTERVLETLQA